MPGCGKTTLGKKLAESLGIAFYDLDELIEENQLKPIAVIFSESGEQYFRKIEREILVSFLANHIGQNYILSLGGGTVCFFDSIQKIKDIGEIVFLNSTIEIIAANLKGAEKKRPMFSSLAIEDLQKRLKVLFENRKQAYENANHIIQFNNNLDESVSEIVNIFNAQ